MRTSPDARALLLASLLTLLAGGVRAEMSPATARAIAIAEDERRFAPELKKYLGDPDPTVRARAALAVGRLQDSTTVPIVSAMLSDTRPEVRREAVFALGQIGHRSARAALEARLTDGDPEVVLLAVEALGKLGDKAATPKVTPLLGATSVSLRATAAVALWRLADSTALQPLIAHHDDPDPEVRWRVLYALEKIVAPDRVLAIAAQHLDSDPSMGVRAYAARTIGRQKSPRGVAYLLQALRQSDLAVKINAVRGLQFIGDTTCVRCGAELTRLLRHPHPYVRLTAATALADRFAVAAADTGTRRAIGDSLVLHLKDEDDATRGAVGRALLTIQGEAGMRHVRPLLFNDNSLYTRVALMNALGDLKTGQSWLGFLQQRLTDEHELLERTTAAEVIGARGEKGSAQILRGGLTDTSLLVVASCASGLAELKDAASVPVIVSAYTERAKDDPDARISLRDALRDLAGQAFVDSIERANPPRPAASRSYPTDFATPPQARGAILHTTRGDIEWTFYAREAPQTVRNFVALVKKGYFEGNLFHRVVPNFVIQDGDPTGTGSGGPGYSIRCEYNQLRYGPGMVGMALSGKDTGGSQWFITHSPQPHLDGRYTIFARVVKGMDVVQKIVQGDRLMTVELLE